MEPYPNIFKHSTNSFVLFLIIFLVSFRGKAQIPNQIICGNDIIESTNYTNNILPLGDLISTNGGVHTPKGELRILIIFAAFSTTTIPAIDANTDIYNWKGNKPMPDNFDNLDALFLNDANQLPVTTSPGNKSISQFYYEMSGGQFKVTADALKDPYTNDVIRVEISPDNIYNWGQANLKVMEKIKELYDGDIDWGKYDNRKNRNRNEYFSDDNSVYDLDVPENREPDLEPDYVVIVYKRGDEDTNPGWRYGYHGFSRFEGLSATNNGQPVFTIKGTDDQNYSFTKSSGFTATKGALLGKELFIHEISHELFSNPHNFLENSVAGDRFFMSNGPSMMTYGRMFSSCNAWEAWYLGWLNLTTDHDIKPSPDPKTITVRDFLSYREPVRVEIPSPGGTQHLWIENRQRYNIFDEKESYLVGANQAPIPPPPTGLYLYLEDMAPTRENPSPVLYEVKPNSIRLLHGAGNHDYNILEAKKFDEWWIPIANAKHKNPNPLGGANDISFIPGDYNGDSEISYYTNWNRWNTGGSVHGLEGRGILKKDGELTYGITGAYNSTVTGSTSVAFNQVGQGAGLSYNPVIAPLQMYNSGTNPKLSPVYLNGLSVKIVAKRLDTGGKGAGEEYDIEIRYNDTDINIDQRFTGEIIQRNVPNAPNDYDVNVKANKTLTINKSGTANRHTKTAANDFINPTTYTCEGGSFFHQEPNSTVVVDQGSTFKLNGTATVRIEQGAQFLVKKESSLVLEPASTLEVKDGAKLQVEQGGQILLKDKNSLIIAPAGELILKSGGRLTIENTLLALTGSSNRVFLQDNGNIEVNTGGRLILTTNVQSSPSAFGQEIIVNNGGSLEIHNTDVANYRIIVKAGGTLLIPELSVANVTNKGQIVIENGGFICVHSDATVNLQSSNNVINLHNGSQKGINPSIAASLETYYGTSMSAYCNPNFSTTGSGSVNTFPDPLYIQNEILSTIQYLTGKRILAGEAVTTSKPQGPVIIQTGAQVTLSAEDHVVLDRGFEVQAGAGFIIEKR